MLRTAVPADIPNSSLPRRQSCTQKSFCHSAPRMNFQLTPHQRESSAGLQSRSPCLSMLLLWALAVRRQGVISGARAGISSCGSDSTWGTEDGSWQTPHSPCSPKGFPVCYAIDNSWKYFLTAFACSFFILFCSSGFRSNDSVTGTRTALLWIIAFLGDVGLGEQLCLTQLLTYFSEEELQSQRVFCISRINQLGPARVVMGS